MMMMMIFVRIISLRKIVYVATISFTVCLSGKHETWTALEFLTQEKIDSTQPRVDEVEQMPTGAPGYGSGETAKTTTAPFYPNLAP